MKFLNLSATYKKKWSDGLRMQTQLGFSACAPKPFTSPQFNMTLDKTIKTSPLLSSSDAPEGA